ncbi:hypothetical protein CLF_104637 [Clonorchis sinensis]|uniref:Uncharacterized protein n=1 Tax=Clonorchis sinensis TaxID=79923 RepID=G7YC06_CLOSI|nr:hypothetical protein CLF_104637 [Clonorchis sinensis]
MHIQRQKPDLHVQRHCAESTAIAKHAKLGSHQIGKQAIFAKTLYCLTRPERGYASQNAKDELSQSADSRVQPSRKNHTTWLIFTTITVIGPSIAAESLPHLIVDEGSADDQLHFGRNQTTVNENSGESPLSRYVTTWFGFRDWKMSGGISHSSTSGLIGTVINSGLEVRDLSDLSDQADFGSNNIDTTLLICSSSYIQLNSADGANTSQREELDKSVCAIKVRNECYERKQLLYRLMIELMADDMFAELSIWLADSSSPVEETSSVCS